MCKSYLFKGDITEFENDIQAKCVKVYLLKGDITEFEVKKLNA